MADARLPRAMRICNSLDFRRVYQRRCTASDEWLLVFGELNGLAHPRLGLSVSRKLGGAVVRNRWKRLLREAFRLSRGQLPPGVDLVVIPRQEVKPELASLMASLPRLAARVAKKLKPARVIIPRSGRACPARFVFRPRRASPAATRLRMVRTMPLMNLLRLLVRTPAWLLLGWRSSISC